MKQKTHSGLKKKVKVRKNGKGAVTVQKAARNHLLVNKSKGQKKKFASGMPVSSRRLKILRNMAPGMFKIKGAPKRKVSEKKEAVNA